MGELDPPSGVDLDVNGHKVATTDLRRAAAACPIV
jgi:hypothetical protein